MSNKLKDKFRPWLFGLVMIVFIAYPIYMIWHYEQVLSQGEVYRFIPEPIDPYNPFSGRYIQLDFPSNLLPYTNADSIFAEGQKIYLQVKEDSMGYAYFSDILMDRPKGPNFITTYVSRPITKKYVSFEIPFSQYYLNEELAPEAEEIYRSYVQEFGDSSMYAEVKIYQGSAVIDEIYLANQTLVDYIKSKQN